MLSFASLVVQQPHAYSVGSLLTRTPGFVFGSTRKEKCGGFSLVEVALALGLISFCLVALFGLLPIGLESLRTANNEAAATGCMEQIVASIRNARLQPATTTVTASTPYQAILKWDLGASDVKATLSNLSAGAFPDNANAAEQRFVAYVKITPPPKDASKPGTALISVAWPMQATWDETTLSWKNAQGSVITQVIFLTNA